MHMWPTQALLAGNQVIGEARRPGPVHRYHQPTTAQVFFRMLRLHERDALAAGGRTQQEQVLVKTRPSAATAVGLDTMSLQPQRPVGTVGVLQEGVVQAVLRLVQRRPAGEQAGAGYRQHHGRQQRYRFQPGVIAQAMAQGDIDRITVQVDKLGRGLHAYVNLRVPRVEISQPRHQPAGRE